MKKRILSLLLALVMCLCLFPASAFAADSDFVIDENGVLTEYKGSGGDVIIPNGVTSIGKRAFEHCYDLTSVTIPDSVTRIEDWTFYGCSSLKSVTIPDSVTSIGEYAFNECTSLTSVTIPDSVTSIEKGAFNECSSLTSVTIPNGVTRIEHYMFFGCSSLTGVTIPNGVTSIGMSAFYGCSSLASVTIPDSVTSIGSDAFADFAGTGLTGVVIPSSVTSIGNGAFSWAQLQKFIWTATGDPSDAAREGNGYIVRGCRNLSCIVGIPDQEWYERVAANWRSTAGRNPGDCILPQSDRVTTLSNEICAGLTTPYDKERAICTWVSENLTYDLNVPNNLHSPDKILDQMSGVCADFASLTQALLQAQGIPAVYISGLVDNGSGNGWEGHAWNAAYLDGRWVYIDSTRGEFDIPLYTLSNDRYADDTSESLAVTPNRSAVLVKDVKTDFEAYTINGNNYFKLRDLAKVLSGTETQFDVTWDGEKNAINLLSGKPYTVVGGEMTPGDGTNKQAAPNASAVYLDGGRFFLAAYTINGNNYVKLRDVGLALDFNVTWDGANNAILINTGEPYTLD